MLVERDQPAISLANYFGTPVDHRCQVFCSIQHAKLCRCACLSCWILAAGTALTAVEDEDGSENPTSGRLPMCGARDGPEVGNEIGVCNVIEGSLPLDLALGGKGVLWPEITGLGAGGVGVGQPSILGLGTGGTATPSTPLGISKERGAGDLLRVSSESNEAATSDGSKELSKAKILSEAADSKVAATVSISKPGKSGSRLCQTNPVVVTVANRSEIASRSGIRTRVRCSGSW